MTLPKNDNYHLRSNPQSGLYDGSPSMTQVGGTHYRDMKVQVSEFNYRNDLNWLEGNAVKYICRHKLKGGRLDLEKAVHYLELLMEWEYGVNKSGDIPSEGDPF